MDSDTDPDSPAHSPKHNVSNEYRELSRRPLPQWFDPGPFRYNGRFALAFLPCGFIVLAIAGELLLAIIAIGALVIHLMDTGGAKRRAVVVYMCIFIMAQMTVIYSAFPLIWKSPVNIILIFLINMFTVLTGGLVLLQFKAFRYEEPYLALTVELGLFCIYPAVCAAIISWASVTLTTVYAAPYYLITYGFLMLRLFLTPTLSSFRKEDPKRIEDSYIVGAVECAAITLLYVMFPVILFIIINFWTLHHWQTLTQLLFALCVPAFLATLLGIRPFLEYQGLTLKHLMMIRWSLGLTSLLLGTVLLYIHGIESALLPWLLPVVIGNLMLGITTRLKQWKIWSNLCGLGVAVVYAMSSTKSLPLQLQNPDLNLRGVSLLLILHSLITVLCVLVSSVSVQTLSLFLIIETILFVIVEHLLFTQDLYNVTMMLLTSFIGSYMLFRLQDVTKISQLVTLLGLSLHSTKLLAFLQSVHLISETGSWMYIFQLFSIMSTVFVISQLLIFEHRQALPRQLGLQYAVSILLTVIVVHSKLFTPIWKATMRAAPSTADMVSSILILSGLAYVKLVFVHMSTDIVARKLNVLIILSGVLINIFQPEGFLETTDECGWMLVMALIWFSAVILSIIPNTQSKMLMMLQAIMLGIPIGTQIIVILTRETSFDTWLCRVAYILAAVISMYLLLLLWNWTDNSKSISVTHTFKTILCLVTSFLLTFFLELSLQPVWDSLSKSTLQRAALPSTAYFCVIFIISSLALKLHCQNSRAKDPFHYSGPGKLEFSGNVLSTMAFFLAILNCPLEYSEIWICTCSVILLLLQEDKYLLQGFRSNNQAGPVFSAIVVILFVSTIIQSDFWTLGLTVSVFIEFLILLSTLTAHITFCTQVWSGYFFSSAKTVCFSVPLNTILFLTGSSYSSWLLGVVGLFGGSWLICYCVPL